MKSYLGRGAERERAETLQRQATDAISPLNDALSELSPAYNGVVYFTAPNFNPRAKRGTASATFGLEAAGAQPDQNEFRRRAVDGRQISLVTTAFGDTLRQYHREVPSFMSSRMNPANHLTLTIPTTSGKEKQINGGLQIALDPKYGMIQDEAAFRAVLDDALPTLKEIGAEFEALETPDRPIRKVLASNAPVDANAFLLRWDTVDSTAIALSDNEAELENYLDDMDAMLRDVTKSLKRRVLRTGDGQNIAIPFPEQDASHAYRTRMFGSKVILPLLDTIQAEQRAIAGNYSAFAPEMRLSVGAGYLHKGSHTGRVFWEVSEAEETPQNETDQPHGPVRYTSAARDLLSR